MKTCPVCATDAKFLRQTERPDYESGCPSVRVADLFAGGGGLTLGVAEAVYRLGLGTTVTLAVENDEAAADVFALNFPKAVLRRSDVAALFDGVVASKLTVTERTLRDDIGEVDVLVAGPPCQGHSDLNNHTRRRDPRNGLYLRVARAAEVLTPTFVLIENVPAVERDEAHVVDEAMDVLSEASYDVASVVLDLADFGVPQRRRRHILIASRIDTVDPAAVLEMESPCMAHERTVQWAIGDLVKVPAKIGPDAPSAASERNRRRMQWLVDNDKYDLPNKMRPDCHHGAHSYVSMYGRLSWDEPAQTITTGFGSMGQGRFVHPALPRTITPHEAARLQTIPDFFDLDLTKGRGAWATVIGNAVPPVLGVHLAEPLVRALPAVKKHLAETAQASRTPPTSRHRPSA